MIITKAFTTTISTIIPRHYNLNHHLNHHQHHLYHRITTRIMTSSKTFTTRIIRNNNVKNNLMLLTTSSKTKTTMMMHPSSLSSINNNARLIVSTTSGIFSSSSRSIYTNKQRLDCHNNNNIQHQKFILSGPSKRYNNYYRHVLNRRGGSSSSTSRSSSSNSDSVLFDNDNDDDDDNVWKNMIPMDMPRRDDVILALRAVRNACYITMKLQPLGNSNIDNNNTDNKTTTTNDNDNNNPLLGIVQKLDYSPVTVADYAVQAYILHTLYNNNINDGFIAEEDSKVLQTDPLLFQQVHDSVLYASSSNNSTSKQQIMSKEQLLHSIDLGQSFLQWNPSNNNNNNDNTKQQQPSRIWCLDPIDGTRGFLRGKYNGGQYCIALALIENGIPVIGILGCPNLPTMITNPTDSSSYEWNENETTKIQQNTNCGCIFVASKDGGCYQIPLFPDSNHQATLIPPQKLHVTSNDGTSGTVSNGRFCVGVEQYSDAYGYFDQIVNKIQEIRPSSSLSSSSLLVRMDSQVKHGIIARGDAEYYMRLPKREYVEYKWDHAAGYVIIKEAGGRITDTYGQSIDFSLYGNQLSSNVRGVLMSNGGIYHQSLVNAYQNVANTTTSTTNSKQQQ